MRVKLVYLHVIGQADGCPPPSHYDPGAKLFLRTYLRHRPTTPHELIIVNCNAGVSNGMFDEVASGYLDYHGTGWDCGAYIHAAHSLDTDFLLCFNSFVYFWRNGWLEPFLKAFEAYGPGLYGPTASYEQEPHIRTPCMAASVDLLIDYPVDITSRAGTCAAEVGPSSFTRFAQSLKLPTKLVTEDGCYDMADWRKPPNIFRRGNQSNILIRDRHQMVYFEADEDRKKRLECLADGLCT